MRNFRALGLSLFFLLSIAIPGWAANTYHVRTDGHDTALGLNDSNDPINGAFFTIQKGLNTAASPGDIIKVHQGSYIMQGRLNSAASGILGNPIILQADDGDTVDVERLYITHDHVIVRGLRFNYSTGSLQYDPMMQIGLVNTRRIGITITGCKFANGGINTYGIAMYTNGASISNNEFTGRYMFIPIHFQGIGNIFDNNNFHDISGVERIWDVGPGSGVIIKNNLIYNMILRADEHPDIIQVAFTDHKYGIFENNKFWGSPDMQIGSIEPNDGTGENSKGWILRDNVFVGGNALFLGSNSWKILNNTFYGSTANPIIMYKNTGSDAKNTEIKNNIFIGCAGISENDGWYIHLGSPPPTGTDADYNYVTKPAANGYGAKSGFNEAHRINGGNPLFNNENGMDFSIRSASPACGTGLSLTSVDKDINGVARPQGSGWDRGAYVCGGETSLKLMPKPPTTIIIQ